MGSYLSVISYPKFDEKGWVLRIEDEVEQEMISYTMQMMFMDGDKNQMRIAWEDKSWSSRNDVVGEIWNMLPTLYVCPTYGKVKYVPTEEIEDYYQKTLEKIKYFTSDVVRLLEKDLTDLEIWIEFANYLKDRKEKNDKQIILILD